MEDFENEFFDDKPKAPNNRKRIAVIISMAAVLGLGLGGAIALLNGTITADILTPQASVTGTCCSCSSPTRTKSPVSSRTVVPSTIPTISPVTSPSTVPGSSAAAIGSTAPASSPIAPTPGTSP